MTLSTVLIVRVTMTMTHVDGVSIGVEKRKSFDTSDVDLRGICLVACLQHYISGVLPERIEQLRKRRIDEPGD